jgi:nucleotide-binding universal stress UspA family protein/nitrite reductase/ring-hydroxylating ferredoxin subunit
MPLRKILVGTDGSPTALIAERAAVALGRATGGSLVVVSAYHQDDGQSVAERVATEAKGRAEAQGVEAMARVAEGRPEVAITETAFETDAQLIVVGEIGMGGVRRGRRGGIPDRVSHTAPCNVLIVRTGLAMEGRVGHQPGQYRRILVATDGSPTASYAVQIAAEMAAALGASLALVYVGDEILGRIALTHTAEQLTLPEVSTSIRSGEPGKAIAAEAAQGYDLVVVGNKGMEGRRLLGSVPNTVSHKASCDVLIVQTVGRTLADLGPGEGAIVAEGGRRVAAYRSEAGEVVGLSPRCKHLGCQVGWNASERTWDCPCHGSRYDVMGKLMQGPAQEDLDRVEL